MRLPRFIFNPATAGWIRLWQNERRANIRLRRERDEWRDKLLIKLNVTPLFTPVPKPVAQVEPPPIGPMAKRAFLARNGGNASALPSAEEIIAAAERGEEW